MLRRIAFYLSVLMVFMIPWEQIVTIRSLGTASRLVGMGVAGIWLYSIVATGRFRKLLPYHAFAILFFLWNIVSLLWTVDVGLTTDRVNSYVRMALFTLMLWDIFETSDDVWVALQAYLLGSFFPVFSVFYNYSIGYQYIYGRYSATGDNPNTTGIVLAFGLPIAWYLASSTSPTKLGLMLKIINFSYVALAFLAIALTATRFAMFMAVPASLYGLWTLTSLGKTARVVVFAALLVAVWQLYFFIPEDILERLGSAGESVRTGDLTGRVIIWTEALNAWGEHPIRGIGSGAFYEVSRAGRSVHNSFLATLAETGFVGFLLFMMVIATAANHARRLPRKEAMFWLTFLAVWGLGNMALTWAHTKSTWLFLNLLMINASMYLYREVTIPSIRSFVYVNDLNIRMESAR